MRPARLGVCGSMLLLFAAVGCGTGGATPPPQHASTASAPSLAAASPPASAEEWRCGGDLVPPTGWEQQTSFEDAKTTNAREFATQQASAELVRRLCSGSG